MIIDYYNKKALGLFGKKIKIYEPIYMFLRNLLKIKKTASIILSQLLNNICDLFLSTINSLLLIDKLIIYRNKKYILIIFIFKSSREYGITLNKYL